MGWVPEPAWTLEMRKISCFCQEWNPNNNNNNNNYYYYYLFPLIKYIGIGRVTTICKQAVGTSHNTTGNPYSFTDNFIPSIGETLLPKAYGKAHIFIHYRPANQRSQQQREPS
jgi:hypothetical protein